MLTDSTATTAAATTARIDRRERMRGEMNMAKPPADNQTSGVRGRMSASDAVSPYTKKKNRYPL
jgi:hypothetical protein